MTIINTSTVGPVVLNGTINPLTITATGTVTSTAAAADAIDGASGSVWTISNSGTLSSSTGYGVSLAGAGIISSSGAVTGKDGLVLRAGGTIGNTGAINATGAAGSGGTSGAGVLFAGASGTVTNGGSITGVAYGLELDAGGLVTNSGAINGGHNAIRVLTAAGTVSNTGSIADTGSDVIGLFAGGSVSNAAGGTIVSRATAGAAIYVAGTSGTVTNAGGITGIDYAVDLAKGGTVTNNTGGIITANRGINILGASGVVSNSGTVKGATSFGVRLAAGGQLTNAAGAFISGPVGVQVYAAQGTVTNNGTISGTSRAVLFTGTGDNRVIAGPTAVFVGAVAGSTAAGSTNTLELAGGAATLSALSGGGGTVTANAASWSFTNFTTLVADTATALTLNGNASVATLLNNGTVDLTGALIVSGAINAASTGVLQIDGKSLEVASATGATTQISFPGASRLTVDTAASFGTGVGTGSYTGPILENFSADDSIDLKNIGSAGAALAYNATTGLLQVSNTASQAATLAFQTSSLASGTFQAASDGSTGVLITRIGGTSATVTENLATDTGSSATDNITSNPALTGTADANSSVTLTEGGTTLGTATANATGVWTFAPASLAQGAHTVVAAEGGASATLTFTYDNVAPAVTAALKNDTGTAGDNITTDPTLTGAGDPNATVTIKQGTTVLGTTTANTSGVWTFTPVGLNQGSNTFVASETDAAGNTASASLTFTLQGTSAVGGVPQYSHIVVVVDENHNYDEIIGNSLAPYINSLATNGALLTNYRAITHPSEPNYLALYAGDTFGVTADVPVTEPDPTIATILQGAGKTFTGYVEHPNSSFDHNPWESFPEGTSVEQDFATFPAANNFASLPTVSFITPNTTDDMHNGTIQQGDSWLQSNLSAYAQWAQANNSLLVVTWDENDDESGATTEPSNQVATILYGANVAAGQYNTAYNHYNLLSTLLAGYGLTGPRNASSAAPIQVFGQNTKPGVTEKLTTDTGASATDNVTSNPAVTGTADANAVITLSEGTTTLGTATANASGVWNFTPTGLAQGSHTVLASETNGSGTTGSALLTFTLDSVAPAVTEILADDTGSPNDNITTDPALTGSGDPNAVVTLKQGAATLGTTTANAAGTWNFTPTGLATGANTITASETDLAGNTGTATLTFTLTAAAGGGTINSSVTGPIVLTGTNNPLTITPTGIVTTTAAGADAIDGGAGSVWTIVNNGTISAATGYGVSLTSAGSITTSGAITGNDGLLLRAGGLVANSGSINASGSLGSGSANGAGIFTTGGLGTVSNTGFINGPAYGVALDAGGLVTNASTIVGGEDGVRITGAAGTVVNSGVLLATVDDGIGFSGGGSVTNAAGATIASQSSTGAGVYIHGGTDATVTNAGSISGAVFAVDLAQGGSVTNSTGGVIASARGVNIQGGLGTVTNSGGITGTTFGVRLSSGGQLTNATGGSISGPDGVLMYGTAATVTNNGTISGSSEAISFYGTGSNRVIVGQSAVFVGNIRGSTATGSTNTLELANGPGSVNGVSGGAGTMTENGQTWSFSNFGTIVVDAGGAWSMGGTSTVPTILDNGRVDISGPLVVSGAIDPASTGLFQFNGNTMEVAAATGATTQFSFLNGGNLKIDSAASFGTSVGTASYKGPLLENFGASGAIDLVGFSPTGAVLNYSAATGLLQISNSAGQVATLSFQPSSLGSGSFSAGSDGATGLLLTIGAATSVTEKLGTDTGASATDNITSNPALVGTAGANAVVTLKIGATTLGTSTASAQGAWSFTPTGLSQGANTIVASTTDASTSLTFTLDSVAPTVTEKLANDTGTADDNITTDPTLTGTGDPNAVVTLKEGTTTLGTATANASGVWTFLPTLSQGAHTVLASETDVAGNTGTASLAFTLTGTTAPGGTISTSVAGPVNLTAATNPLTITSTGTVTSTASGVDAVDGAAGTTWTVVNNGALQSTSGNGVSLASAGTISTSGLVSGKSALIVRGGGTVTNSGSLSASGAVGGGSSVGSGVFMSSAGTVANSGFVTAGAYGVALDGGGLVTNTGSLTGGEDGVRIEGAVGTVTNTGAIFSTVDDGLGFFAGGSVSNSAGAVIGNKGTKGAGIYITGATGNVTNAGSIGGVTYAIDFGKGGSVTNATGGLITSQRGVEIHGAAGTVVNSGSIGGSSSFGVHLAAGGQVTNNAGATISGPIGVTATAAATITNNGTISGTSQSVSFTGTGANRLEIGATSVMTGPAAGSTATGSINTLELIGGTGTLSALAGGAGTVNENAHTWSFSHFNTIGVDAGGAWSLNGNNSVATILNNGTIDLGGALTVTTAVDPASSGIFRLDGKAMEVAAALGTNTQFSFLGASQLTVDNIASFGSGVGTSSYNGPLLETFDTDDKIDLKTFGQSGLALNFDTTTGILQVSNSTSQAADLKFQTASLGSGSFHAAGDAASGIFITHA